MAGAHGAGGSLILAGLIEEHWEALQRDFWFFYRIDLQEELFVKEETSWGPSRILAFLEKTPEGSEFWAEKAGGREHRDWGTLTYLVASTVNAVNSLSLIMANAPKSARKNFPMITGPESPKAKKRTTNADIAAIFGAGGN